MILGLFPDMLAQGMGLACEVKYGVAVQVGELINRKLDIATDKIVHIAGYFFST
jgi:hypothetical protein